MTRALVMVGFVLVSGTPASAAEEPAGEAGVLIRVRTAYEYGKFKKAYDDAQGAIDRGHLTDEELIELHKFAGLAAFSLDRLEDADRHFHALLEKSPDFDLDPFSVEPPALRFFEQTRTKYKELLEVIRRGIRARAERLRELADEEERRRRLEQELARHVTVKTVERRNFSINFVPFGGGQFQQGRIRAGVIFAVSEAALGAASLTGWIVRNALATTGQQYTPIQTNGPIGQPDGASNATGVASRDAFQDKAWRFVQYGSAAAFFAAYAAEVADAVYHHEDQVVTATETVMAPSPADKTPATPQSPAPSSPTPVKPVPIDKGTVPLGPGVRGSSTSLSPQPFFFPTTAGAGAGITLHF